MSAEISLEATGNVGSVPAQDLEQMRLLLNRGMDAFNAVDPAEMARINHYPHVRIAGPAVRVWNTAGEYEADNSTVRLQAKGGGQQFTGWSTSAFNWMNLVQFTGDIAHVAVSFSRLDAAGNAIATFESLRILTKENDVWGVKGRSSFAGIANGGAF